MEHVVIVGELVFSSYRIIFATSHIWKVEMHVHSLSHLLHRHICYLLGPVIASFCIAEKLAINLGLKVLYNVHDDTKLEPVRVCKEDKSG